MQRSTFQKRIRNTRILIIILIVIFFILGITYSVLASFNDHDYIITVTDKDRIYEGDKEDGDSKYLIFGDDENNESLVFENTDTIMRFKWNSSNIQSKLHEGKTYKITVIGYRVPFLSMYENIIEVEEYTNENTSN